MKWHVFSVGHARGDELEPFAQEYAVRISRRIPCQLRVFPSEEALDRAIGNRRRIVLAERGVQAASSEALAQRIEQLLSRETRDIVFVIGGAHGHSREFLDRADECWSLSNLTFPHRLARLILLEQLYRALSILYHEPYHH